MRSAGVALGGWLVLVVGACGRPLGAGGSAAPSGGGSPAPDAAPRPAAGGGAPGQDGGAPDAGDDGGSVAATTGMIIYPEIAPYTHDTCSARTPAGWCWVEPRPQGNALADLSSPRAGELWAVGSAGTVLHGIVTGYEAVDWTLVDVGLASDLTAVSASADGAVFIGSASGEIVRGDATAGGWTELPAPGLARVTGLWAASGDDAWAVGAEPTAYHWTTAGGWTAADASPDGVVAVIGRAVNDVFMASELGHAVHWDGTTFAAAGDILPGAPSTNAGSNAGSDAGSSPQEPISWLMGMLADGTIWAASSGLSSDSSYSGSAWVLSGGSWSPASAYTLAGDSLTDYWAAGYRGNAIAASPGGPDAADETFLGDVPILAGRMSDLWAIAGTTARHGSYSWDPVTSLFLETDYVHVAASGDVWVTGVRDPDWKAQAARWDGAQWSLYAMTDMGEPPIAASNGTDVWLAATSLWHWNGGTLDELPYPTSPTFPAVGWTARQLVAVPGAVWILGYGVPGVNSALLRTDGKTWRSVPLPASYAGPGNYESGLAGTSDRDLWLVEGLSVFHYDGQSWSDPVVLPGSGQFSIRAVWPVAADDVWAGLYHFDGRSWTATAPADSLGDVFTMWADADDDVWAMTSTGLRRFDGQAWSGPVALPTNGYSWYYLSAISPGDLWLAGGGIIHGAPLSAAASR